MTDLTTLLICATLLIVSFSVLRFLRWYFKYENDTSTWIDQLKASVSALEKENAELKRKVVYVDEHLSDLS